MIRPEVQDKAWYRCWVAVGRPEYDSGQRVTKAGLDTALLNLCCFSIPTAHQFIIPNAAWRSRDAER